MHENLVRKVGGRGQDNLIAGLFPRAFTTGIKIAAGAGMLERGTVLSAKEDGTCETMAAGGSPAYPGGPCGCFRDGGCSRCCLPQREFQSPCGHGS